MINIFKKLILTLSLIVVVTMGLSKWGPQVTLQADTQAPGTYVHNTFLSDLGQVIKINNNTINTGEYLQYGYNVVPKTGTFNVSLKMPDFRNEIGDWESINITNSYLRIKALYVGEESQRSFQTIYGMYDNVVFTKDDAYVNQLSPMTITANNIDANTLPSEITFQMALFDSRLSFQPFTGLSGEFRIYSIELRINYTYNDEISPILDGAGSLVESKNLLKPTIGTSTTLFGVSMTVNPDYSITLNGTATAYFSIDLMNLTGVISVKYYYVSGDITFTNTGFFNITIRDTSQNSVKTFANQTQYIPDVGHTNISTSNFKLRLYGAPSTGTINFSNFTFKIQVESGTENTTWTHPDSIYYSTASI